MRKQDTKLIKVKSATKKGYEIAEQGDSVNYSAPNSQTRRGRVGKGIAQTLDSGGEQAVVKPTQLGQSSQTYAYKNKYRLFCRKQ